MSEIEAFLEFWDRLNDWAEGAGFTSYPFHHALKLWEELKKEDRT